MKMAKKFLAVALAGVLALSVLTGCGASVKSKDIADSLTKMGVKVEQDDGVDKTAKETLKAIEAIIASDTNTAAAADDKITLDNAVKVDGKVIMKNRFQSADIENKVQKALGMMSTGSPAETENNAKQVYVALVKTENATKDASLQAHRVEKALIPANVIIHSADKEIAETGKLGSAKTSDGKYILVVIVNDVVAKS